MSESSNKNNKFVVAIHGGAGVIEPNDLTPEKAEELHEALKHALKWTHLSWTAGT